MKPQHLSELTRCRAFHGLTEEDCLVWFGVGMGTLERIEAGEVEPSEDLEHRIVIFLRAVGGGSLSASPAPEPLRASFNGGSTGAGGAVAPASGANFQSGGARS